VLAERQYQEWQRYYYAIVRNKQIETRATLTREENDKIASDLLPLQVKAYIIVRLAA
jgi:hypothetical protein